MSTIVTFAWWDDAVEVAQARGRVSGRRQRVEQCPGGWRVVQLALGIPESSQP